MKKAKLQLREPAMIALQTLAAHKLRSFLTLLGIIISVVALIGVVSVIEGAKKYISERIANFGANTFYVARYGIITNAKDFLDAQRRNKKITMEDYEYLRDNLTLAEEVGALDGRGADIRAGKQNLEGVGVRGVTPNLIKIFRESVETGRYITESDYRSSTMVAFIGADIRTTLFPNVDPIGKTIYIRSLPFEIVGLAEKVGSVFGQSQDNFINIPLSTFQKVFGKGSPNDGGLTIGVRYSSAAVREQTKDQARVLIRTLRKQKYDEKDSFGVIESSGVVEIFDNLLSGIFGAFITIASVFLVVGGIVIMNIMLASVTERTREIGIRKALGAKRSDIRMQFLTESSILAGIGGTIGVLLGYGLSILVNALTPIPSTTPIRWVVACIVLSTMIGLFFGVYPATKAARLSPVDALRAE